MLNTPVTMHFQEVILRSNKNTKTTREHKDYLFRDAKVLPKNRPTHDNMVS